MIKYFFIAGHVQYARYLTHYVLEMHALPSEVKADLVSGAFVCRHREGYWNAVSVDQFGEGIAEFAGLEFAGLENDGLQNDGVVQEQTYILHTIK